jgi:hypothetical protein
MLNSLGKYIFEPHDSALAIRPGSLTVPIQAMDSDDTGAIISRDETNAESVDINVLD